MPFSSLQTIFKNREMHGGRKIKIMKDKADNSRGREKDEISQAYISYSDYEFPKNKTRHPRCKNAADYVLC